MDQAEVLQNLEKLLDQKKINIIKAAMKNCGYDFIKQYYDIATDYVKRELYKARETAPVVRFSPIHIEVGNDLSETYFVSYRIPETYGSSEKVKTSILERYWEGLPLIWFSQALPIIKELDSGKTRVSLTINYKTLYDDSVVVHVVSESQEY